MKTACPRCGASLSPWDTHCPACGDATRATEVSAAAAEAREAVQQRLAEAARAEYEIVGELGRGGMGWVFLGRDRRLGRSAALKVLPPLDALRPQSLERFRREAETAARLQHPNIVPIYGVGGDMATPYFAMAYVEGETLASRLEREGALPLAEALRIAREIGGALAYAHRQGVVHRDIKPTNILLERDTGRAQVTDFGVARVVSGEHMTASGAAIGTPGYWAPEQAAGAPDVDARADVYAFGIVTFEMLTGALPPRADFGAAPVPSSEVRRAALRRKPDLPPGLVNAVVRAVAPQRGDRWATMDEFLAALAPYETAGPGVARAERRWQVLTRAGIAVTAVAAIAGVAILLKGGGTGGPPARGAQQKIALMPYDGDSAAADSLYQKLRYQLEGFSHLLADPRVFAPPGRTDPTEETRALARKAGAAWILHGLVERSARGLQISSRLVNAETGEKQDIGRVEVAAMDLSAADSVVLLLARSTPGREIGLGRGPGPSPASPEAVRAYISAEQAFGHADYTTAVREYGRVIELDSTFGAARYKRFLAELQQEPDEFRLRVAVDSIRQFVGRVRLGPLEQELLHAYLVLFDSGNVFVALERLEDLVRRDSTFLDGWFALGEVRYHFGALAGQPPDSAVRAFERALGLWADAAPALMHLLALKLWLGREEEAKDLIRRYLAQDSTSPIGQTVRVGQTFLFGSLSDQNRLRGQVQSLDERVLEFGAITGAQVARNQFDRTSARLALDALAAAGRSPRVRAEAARFLPASYAAEGRWRDAAREIAAQRAGLGDDPDVGRWPAVAYLVGFGSAEAAERAVSSRLAARTAGAAQRATDLWLAGAVAASRGNVAAARGRLTELRALTRAQAPASAVGMRDALDAAIAETERDTVRARSRYMEALRSLNMAGVPFTLLSSAWLPRYRLARLLLAEADTAGALRLFEAQDFLAAYVDQVLRGPVWLEQARIAAARGDTERARRYATRAVELLRYADAPWSPLRDSAEAVVAALGGTDR